MPNGWTHVLGYWVITSKSFVVWLSYFIQVLHMYQPLNRCHINDLYMWPWPIFQGHMCQNLCKICKWSKFYPIWTKLGSKGTIPYFVTGHICLIYTWPLKVKGQGHLTIWRLLTINEHNSNNFHPIVMILGSYYTICERAQLLNLHMISKGQRSRSFGHMEISDNYHNSTMTITRTIYLWLRWCWAQIVPLVQVHNCLINIGLLKVKVMWPYGDFRQWP